MNNSNKKIFLNYAKEDFEIAERIYGDLTQAGLEVWFDKVSLLPGQNWKIEIKKAIKNSWRFLALISSKSVNKRGYIQKELKEAIEILDEIPESDILIVPVRIEDCEPPERLKELHWVDLFDSYEKGLLQILRVLKTQNYRDFPISLSIYDAKDIIKKFDFFHLNWNKNGRGFVKQYELQIAEGDNIIIDSGPGLIWQRGGAPTRLDYHESEDWIADLNSKSYAGFRDWRKPTLEEAMSLMEGKKENNLFMNQIFDGEKNSIWTSDTINDQNKLFAWVVQFDMGICKIDDVNSRHYIKAVRNQPISYLIRSENLNLIEHYKILNSARIDIQS